MNGKISDTHPMLWEALTPFMRNASDLLPEVFSRVQKTTVDKRKYDSDVYCKERAQEKMRLLCDLQIRFREPERTMLCDILANGQLLQAEGKRYICDEHHHCKGEPCNEKCVVESKHADNNNCANVSRSE